MTPTMAMPRVPGLGPTGSHPEDDERLRRIQEDGDWGAFDELVARHHREAVSYYAKRLGDYYAEDTAQVFWLNAWKWLAKATERVRSWPAWFVTGLRWTLLATRSHLKAAIRNAGLPSIPLHVLDDGNKEFLYLPDPSEGPESLALGREMVERVERAVAGLTPHRRRAVAARLGGDTRESTNFRNARKDLRPLLLAA